MDLVRAILPFVFKGRGAGDNPLKPENEALKEKNKELKSWIRLLVISLCVAVAWGLLTTVILAEVLLHTVMEE